MESVSSLSLFLRPCMSGWSRIGAGEREARELERGANALRGQRRMSGALHWKNDDDTGVIRALSEPAAHDAAKGVRSVARGRTGERAEKPVVRGDRVLFGDLPVLVHQQDVRVLQQSGPRHRLRRAADAGYHVSGENGPGHHQTEDPPCARSPVRWP